MAQETKKTKNKCFYCEKELKFGTTFCDDNCMNYYYEYEIVQAAINMGIIDLSIHSRFEILDL